MSVIDAPRIDNRQHFALDGTQYHRSESIHCDQCTVREHRLRPWLAETLVDHQRFSGACYRAANWLDVGPTTGRGRQDRDDHGRH